MVEGLEGYSQITVDPRMISEIQANRAMSDEQGSGFMSKWGGPEAYKLIANMPEDMRLTYVGYLKGFANSAEIAEVTGLDIEVVNQNIRSLGRQGLIVDYKDLIL